MQADRRNFYFEPSVQYERRTRLNTKPLLHQVPLLLLEPGHEDSGTDKPLGFIDWTEPVSSRRHTNGSSEVWRLARPEAKCSWSLDSSVSV